MYPWLFSTAFASCQVLVSAHDADTYQSSRNRCIHRRRIPGRADNLQYNLSDSKHSLSLPSQFLGSTFSTAPNGEIAPRWKCRSTCSSRDGPSQSLRMDTRPKRTGRGKEKPFQAKKSWDSRKTKRFAGNSAEGDHLASKRDSRKRFYGDRKNGPGEKSERGRPGSKERLTSFGKSILFSSTSDRFRCLDDLKHGRIKPKTDEVNEVLTGLCRSRRMEDAHHLIDAMVSMRLAERAELIHNVKTYTIMIDICGKSKQLSRAFSLFYSMQRDGLIPNVITFNSMIAACARNNEPELAFELFKEMEDSAIAADKFTFGALIDSCAKYGKVDLAFEMAELMDQRKINKDQTIYSALMDACGRANQVDRAFSVFEDMKKAGVFPNLITFSLLIDTCANARELEKAFQIFSEIRHWGFPNANVVVYTALINCCSKAGEPEKAKMVLKSMLTDNVTPNAITFGAYIDGWCRAGRLDEAFEALQEMISEHQCEPNSVLLGGLVDNTRRLRELHRAKRLWEIMVQFNVRISRIFYPSLMAMAARNGDVDVAVGIAFYVLGTGFLRRCGIRSEDPFQRVLAHAIIYLKYTIDSTEEEEVRHMRQSRMAVLYESTDLTLYEMKSIGAEAAYEVCVQWGDDHSRSTETQRRNEKAGHNRARHARQRFKSARFGRHSIESPG